MAGRTPSRSMKAKQLKPHFIALRVTGTGTAVIDEGGNEVTLTDNGTGDYTFTFGQAFARLPVVVATTCTANTFAIVPVADISASAFKVKTFNVSAQAATDAVFHVHVIGFDAADVI
jgi:hypothetical protein